MAASSLAETREAHGCRVVLRRVVGPTATELHLLCQPQPQPQAGDPGEQAEAIYRALLDALAGVGAGFASVVSETIFLRDPKLSLPAIRRARRSVLASSNDPGLASGRPVPTEIEQAPIAGTADLAILVQALVPRRPDAMQIESLETADANAGGLRVLLGHDRGVEERIHAGGLVGEGGAAYEQTLGMFGRAEEVLHQAGLEFRDVVRTWIHLREMERDYAELNRARRDFFASRGIAPAPASTGIGGGPMSPDHDLCLGFYAMKGGERTVMTAPTLNEAPQYGADFVRGMRVVDANKIALHVSGTASIDESGQTAHVGDVAAQADRMLLNVRALLEGQGAGFGDIVSGITYVKQASDADVVRARLREAGFEGFPNVVVEATVCRPELLCETEVLAIRPLPTD